MENEINVDEGTQNGHLCKKGHSAGKKASLGKAGQMFSKYSKNAHVEVRLDVLCQVQKSKAMGRRKEMLFGGVGGEEHRGLGSLERGDLQACNGRRRLQNLQSAESDHRGSLGLSKVSGSVY